MGHIGKGETMEIILTCLMAFVLGLTLKLGRSEAEMNQVPVPVDRPRKTHRA